MNKRICILATVFSVAMQYENVMAYEPSVKIYEAYYGTDIQNIFNKLDIDAKNTLLISDEDNTTVYRYGHEFGNGHMKQWAELARQELIQTKQDSRNIGKWKQTYYRDHIKLPIDSVYCKFLKQLQDKGYKLILLTAKLNEDFGKDEKGEKVSAHDIYNQEHIKFGIAPGKGWENLPSTKLNTKRKVNLPDYIDGVIYAGHTSHTVNNYKQNNKVIALHKFIAYAKEYNQLNNLKTIIAIDDRESEIEALREYAREKEYQFIGIVFKGYKTFPVQKNFDEEYEKKRLETLRDENKWLLPKEADKLFYKDENGIWHLKEDATHRMDSTMPSLDDVVIKELFNKPQGKIELNSDKSLHTLKQSPCEVTP